MNKYFTKIEENISLFNFSIVSKNFKKPWEDLLVIDESQTQEFSNKSL